MPKPFLTSKLILAWTDNSNNETSFEIWRSTDPNTGFITVGNAPANATSYQDSSLTGNTTYYYKIRAIGQYGESALVPTYDLQAKWGFNNNYNDESGNNRTLSPNNSPTFSTDSKEGSHSVDLNGSDEDINVNTSSGDYLRGGYASKTVAFWMKADAPANNNGIFDFGGSDDGLAMRTNSNTLFAGVASNNTRLSLSTPYSSTGWNHIALVYSRNTLRLYLNGTQVASNTNLGFTSVGTTSDASRIGDDNGNDALNTSFGQFNGRFDDFRLYVNALSQPEVNNLMNNGTLNSYVSATTFPLPPSPQPPSNLVASGVTTSQITLTWNDNSTTETLFELHRSAFNINGYRLLATIPGGAGATKSYIDSNRLLKQ